MKSIHFPAGIIPAMAAALALAACGSTTAASTGASSGAALIHTASVKVGDKTQTVLKNKAGLTRYYFTPDTATTIACTGGCDTTWPPLLADAGTPTSAGTRPRRRSAGEGAAGMPVRCH